MGFPTENGTMPAGLREQVAECIAETIAELEGRCKLTLYDIYGSQNGFYEFEVLEEETTENAKSDRIPDHTTRGH